MNIFQDQGWYAFIQAKWQKGSLPNAHFSASGESSIKRFALHNFYIGLWCWHFCWYDGLLQTNFIFFIPYTFIIHSLYYEVIYHLFLNIIWFWKMKILRVPWIGHDGILHTMDFSYFYSHIHLLCRFSSNRTVCSNSRWRYISYLFYILLIDSNIQIWSTEPIFSKEKEDDENTERLLSILKGHSNVVNVCRWSPDGKYNCYIFIIL